MKIGILNRIVEPDIKKILDAALIIYLILVTFYGKLFLPAHIRFFDKYPLIFPLLMILIFRAALFSLKITHLKRDKTDNKRVAPKHREDATAFFKLERFNALPKKHYLTMILILLVVFCIKSYISKGITSHIFHPDEEIRITDLLKMLNSGSLDYERYNQPPLFYYSNFVIFSIYYNLELKSEYGAVANVPYYRWYEFGRQINSAYGAMFAAAVFVLCYQIFGFMYGLLASFAALISPLRLNIDSLFRTQPASDFWVVLVFIILISLLRKPKTIKFALLGILASLAICSFFIKLVIALPIGIFLLFRMIREKRWTKDITIFAVSILLVTLLLMIAPIKNPKVFREKLHYQSLDLEKPNLNPTDLDKINVYRTVTYWTQKDGVGYGIFALSVIGIVIGLMKRSGWSLFVYSMIAAHYLLIGSFQKTYNRYSAFLVPFYFLFAFLALETARGFIQERKWLKEKTAHLLSGLMVTLCLIPFLFNFADVMKDTARPHNLDLFLEWRESNHMVDVPALSLVRSIKLKGWGVVVIPEKYLIKPDWDNLSNFISKRYKILLCSNRIIGKYFKDWKVIKSFDEKTGKGGRFYVLENSIPAENLKKDTQLIKDKIPKSWRRL